MHRFALLITLAACSSAETDRTAWLVEQIHRDNRPWLSRDLELLRFKFQRMAEDPYDYMRATAGVSLRDLERTGGVRSTTSFITEPEAASVLLVGDPHPENFGCFLPGDRPPEPDALRIEVNDFDAVGFGPWIWDVRRAALGVRAVFAGAESCDAACQDGAAAALARGWAAEIGAREQGDGPVADPTASEVSSAVSRLLNRCRTRGARDHILERETLADADGNLRIRLDEGVDEVGRGNLPLDQTDRAQIERLVAQWTDRNPDFSVTDAVRTYGRGVASMPAIRYVVLVERPQGEAVEQRLLQLREVVDPPAIPGVLIPIEGLFPDQPRRMVEAPRMLWSRADADPRLDALTDGPVTFKVSSWESWWDGFDHEDIAEALDRRRLTPADVEGFAHHLGALLAGHHARGRTASGWPALDPLAADLAAGGPEVLVDEVVEASAADWSRILADHALFQAALAELGPTLGVERIYTEEGRR